MKKVLTSALFLLVWLPARAGAQPIVVSQPAATPDPVKAADDFATRAFQDPWDMDQRTDLGWFIHSLDQPSSNLSPISFSNGIFSATATSNDPSLFLLETGFPGSAPVGKIGTNFPIETNRYRVFAIRLDSDFGSPNYFQLFWNTTDITDGVNVSNGVLTRAGWGIYIVDIPALGAQLGQAWNASALRRVLRLDPTIQPGDTIQIDWARLVEADASTQRTIQWSGTGPVDIYLDNNSSAPGGPTDTLGLLASGVSGTTYTFYAGALPPGDYWVAIRRAGTNDSFAYSPGFYRVNAIPTLTITSPSDGGSSDDFATTQLNNAWDMASVRDVDFSSNLSSLTIGTVSGVVNERGQTVGTGTITALTGLSTTGTLGGGPCTSHADPVVDLFHESFRGFNYRIDPARYRILTVELGLPAKARDICNGSVVRVVWRAAGDTFKSVSEDIILNSRADANVLSEFSVEMNDLPVDPGSPNPRTWRQAADAFLQVDAFRVDPHEFYDPTNFFIKRVKLAALEEADASFMIRWTSSELSGTVTAYWDVDRDPLIKTSIGSTVVSSTSGSMPWNTSSQPDGEYYIYVEFNDGTNTNGVYSRWPIKVDHTPRPTARLVPDRTTLNFGATNSGVTRTSSQTVRVSVVDASGPPVCWTASSDQAFFLVSPTTQVCGGGEFTVTLRDQAYAVGTGAATITISSTNVNNSPQYVRAWIRTYATSTPPTGFVDTPPGDPVNVSGSVGITGWVVDDVGVTRVTICRNPVGGDVVNPDSRCGTNQIYVGDAVFLNDSRPDIEGTFPTAARNYRGGWGFLLLTNTLPNQGNGTFVFHMRAFDVEGNQVVVGTKTLIVNNAAAAEPFGGIDTPGQGETIDGTAYVHFGWAMTPKGKCIPFDGSTIFIYIDGMSIGNPIYGFPRSDIDTIFPDYCNTGKAVGYRYIDTTVYANGVHTIVWGVTDDHGAAGGIGSRYFTIFNGGGGDEDNDDNEEAATTLAARLPVSPGPDFGRTVSELVAVPDGASATVRHGAGPAPSTRVRPAADGVLEIGHVELERLELRLDGADTSDATFDAYMLIGDRLMALPIGSAFDPKRGVLYWQPGVGYIGAYEFMVVRTTTRGERAKARVRVRLEPKSYRSDSLAGDLHPAFRRLFASEPY